jgi:NAD-dependent deacetylase
MNQTEYSNLLGVRERLTAARSVAVLTGAGISADSGVPTFRGPEGLWRNFRAEDLATPEAFARDPKLVWEWYDWRRGLLATKTPNPAHHALVEIERRADRFTLITQNVDGLHAAAGSERLIELHGNIWRVRCTQCGTISRNDDVPMKLLPYCVGCAGLLRPHIVWFGEMLNSADIAQSEEALQSCDLLLIIGTSGVVYPAAGFAAVARAAGAFVAELNLDPTPNSSVVHVSVAGRAKDLVPQLL